MILDAQEAAAMNFGGMTVGLTSGCFDLLHPHHLYYLERCAAMCDVLLVGVDSDGLVEFFKKKTPNIFERGRVEMVAALKCVHGAFIMRNLDQFGMVAARSQMIFKNDLKLYGEPIVGAEDCELIVIPDVELVSSTTALVKKIRRKRGS